MHKPKLNIKALGLLILVNFLNISIENFKLTVKKEEITKIQINKKKDSSL